MTDSKFRLTRRGALAGATAAIAAGTIPAAHSAEKIIHIPIDAPFTGGEAEGATLVKDGAAMAIDEINAKGGVAGYKLELVLMDDGSSNAGGYDPAQAAINARRMVSDKLTYVALGPYNSGCGKAMSPILSQASLPIITPTSTNPDITSPKFAHVFRPAGPAIYFRTVTTDAYQGPNMANYYKQTLKVTNVYVLDDGGAYGVGIADSFEAQAAKIGIKVLGRDRLDPKAADYSPILTKMKSIGVTAMYYGGDAQAGIKVVKQSYDILPGIVKGGGDGMYESEILSAGGFPAAEGWYATIAAPHLLDDPDAKAWVQRYAKIYGKQPSDYSITGYDAALVAADALGRAIRSGSLSREMVRNALETTNIKTLQGSVSFDKNGDLTSRVISVFQIKHDAAYPTEDMAHQYKYVGVAPQDATS